MKMKRVISAALAFLFTLSIAVFSNTNASITKAITTNIYTIGGIDYNTTSRVYDSQSNIKYSSDNHAMILSNTIPNIMEPGKTYPVSLTVKNTGFTTWSSPSYYLGFVGDKNPFASGPVNFNTCRVTINGSVAPGQIYTFNFNLTAPSTLNTYYANLQMVDQFNEWFGSTLGKIVTVKNIVSAAGNNAEILSDTIPDVVETGKTYNVSVTVKNTGDTTWLSSTADYKTYYLGAAQDDNPFAPAPKTFKSARIFLDSNVSPGEVRTLNFTITAPDKPGIYTSKWRMVRQFDSWFGSTLAKSVTVKKPALIFKDVNPWNLDSNERAAAALGVPYTVLGSSQFASINLEPNKYVVWIANDQTQIFYNNYAANQVKFDNFVNTGGTMLFGAADEGWNMGSLSSTGATLPGNIGTVLYYDDVNYNIDPNHPIMNGVSASFIGNSASHDYFTNFVNLPVNATILCNGSNNSATLAEYSYGSGKVIATGQPLEFYFNSINSSYCPDESKIFINIVKYVFSIN